FFFSSRRRHTRVSRDWSSDVCSSDLKDLAVECGGFNEQIGKYFEDYFLWNLIAEKAKVENLPKVLLKYRMSSGSIMSTLKSRERSEERRVGKESRYRGSSHDAERRRQ